MLEETQIAASLFDTPRTVWLQRLATDGQGCCLVFLDAELYLQRVDAATIVARMHNEGHWPSLTCVYLSAFDGFARHRDYTCNESYAQFLCTELLPWIASSAGSQQRYILCGLSLSGLQAAYTALHYPAAFTAALCQSPSAWWNGEWLTNQVPSLQTKTGRFWLSVGRQELTRDVAHPPTDLYQAVDQLTSCRRLAGALEASGHELRLHAYDGGHDPACWAEELSMALQWLLR